MTGNLLGNSSMPNYIKLMAGGILALTYTAALFVATRDYLANVPVPIDVASILGTGVGMALTALGYHQGASATEQALPVPTTTTTSTTTTKSVGSGGSDNNNASTPTT